MTAKTLGLYEESKTTNSTAVVIAMKSMELKNKQREDYFGLDKTRNSDNKDPKSRGLFDNKIDAVEPMSEEAQMIESLFPKSTRKDGETPTIVQMDTFYSEVLNRKTFSPSGKPDLISGGYLIRGTNQKENGDALINALDSAFKKSSLADQVSFFYINDPSSVTEDQLLMGERPPVIFVTGPSVIKENNYLLSALLSALGLGGISFLSVYPFVLNNDIAARVDEQLTLATSAGGGADLDFLSDLTSPIFFTYLAIQFGHEMAHFAVSKLNGFDMAVPGTFVPSPLLGTTSTITALRSSPKNKTSLLDFAIAGPLTGMLLSILSIYLGLQFTLDMDMASYNGLPVLPVSFLRQSSLGGGIIESVLGATTLTGVPNPAEATMHIHPLVVAGYSSLLVNAFNLTPFGRTDGGRVALSLFGRSGAQLVGLLTLLSLFVGGILTSDAMLLYFAFILFYQNELEIPMRNEVDDVDFSRVLIATVSGVLVLLTIIPM